MSLEYRLALLWGFLALAGLIAAYLKDPDCRPWRTLLIALVFPST